MKPKLSRRLKTMIPFFKETDLQREIGRILERWLKTKKEE